MKHSQKSCPDCESTNNATPAFLRRDFLRVGLATTASLAYATLPRGSYAAPEINANAPETLVKLLFEKLSEKQRSEICFAWDHQDPNRGLLRTRVSNNWHITPQVINSDYYTKEQQSLIRQIFEGIIQPEWHAKIDKQLKDDAGGFGNQQNIAIFGKPGEGKFELVMTGRHMTLRCDGNTTENVAFGGPLFYGHAASGFNENPEHPGNVFWEQALAANAVYAMLDGKQRKLAEAGSKDEELVAFQGKSGKFDGISVGELSADQKALVQNTLQKLIEPYRQSDRDEVLACLQKQGGLDACHLTFYTDDDLGDDKIWDNWRIEGPAFVWHYRGSPHVHVWANIADDPTVKTNV
jgi:Protein of unknown function (DUF3500)